MTDHAQKLLHVLVGGAQSQLGRLGISPLVKQPFALKDQRQQLRDRACQRDILFGINGIRLLLAQH